jgi:hypothetical protein
MVFETNASHLEAFSKRRDVDEYAWAGNKEAPWFGSLKSYIPMPLPNLQQCARPPEDLERLCRRKDVAIEEKFLACMAWGAMRRSHARSAWEMRDRWRDPLLQICNGDISRAQAFEMMKSLQIKGLGVAYFTKLIFFLLPSDGPGTRGYILDQWTARSTNLLLKHPLVQLNGGWVNQHNTGKDYEAYCKFVEFLAEHFLCKPEVIERQLFSKGGKGKAKGAWRRYVLGARV